MKRKTDRVELRLTPDAKENWLRLCEELPGNTQSQKFRNLVEKLTTETNAVIDSGELKNNND